MYLYTNGCSWTYGGGLNLDKPEQKNLRLINVWPHHLGKILNCKNVLNLAQGCGSNQRIFRTTLNWLINTPREILDNTIAVIQWTEWSRFELYLPNKHENNEEDEHAWTNIKIDAVLGGRNIDSTEILSITNNFLQLYHRIEGFYRNLSFLEATHSLFTENKIKYFYWSHTNDFDLSLDKSKLVKKYNWLGETYAYQNWKYETVSDVDAHPSFEGHKQLAQIIAEYIKPNL